MRPPVDVPCRPSAIHEGRKGILLIVAGRPTTLLVMAEDLASSSDESLAALVARCAESVQAMRTAHAAMEILHRQHGRRLLSFLAARVSPRSDAEDVYQLVWQKLWHHLPRSGFTGDNFRALLYQIARNAVIDHHRKARPEARDDLETLVGSSADPALGLLEAEREEALRRCLEKLEVQIVELVRSRLAGEGYPEICKRLDVDARRAHMLYHKASKQLQSCVERELS